MTLAPIVLFVYNRPWHTGQTLNALMQNELADQSVLYIYADGPKANATSDQLEKIQEVRKVIRSENWCKDVHIIESEKNKGLADSIVDGVTEIVNKYGRIIVLEDDIVTSRGFLKYMNDALTLYENNEKVMHVSGFVLPNKLNLPETIFYNSTTCWGWATWKRAWKLLEVDSEKLLNDLIAQKNLQRFDRSKRFGYIETLERNINGTIKTWAIKWHSSVFLQRGFCLHPGKSLVNNIGLDNSGENCISTNKYYWNSITEKVNVRPIRLREDKKYKKVAYNFHSPNKPPLMNTINKHMFKILKKII